MVFIFGIVLLVSWTILDKFGTSASGVLNTSIIEGGKSTLQLFNAGIIIIVIAVGIVIILSGFLLQSHPAFLILGIITLVVVLFVAAQFSNFFLMFAEETSMTEATSHFNLYVYLMQHFPLILGVIGIVFCIVTFSKYYYGD